MVNFSLVTRGFNLCVFNTYQSICFIPNLVKHKDILVIFIPVQLMVYGCS